MLPTVPFRISVNVAFLDSSARPSTETHGVNLSRRKKVSGAARSPRSQSLTHLIRSLDDSESESEDESEPEEAEAAPGDGLQTPSGLETPSGMHSVVSTVPGGLETPDFLELRKGRESSEVADSGPRSLYQVVPERQTAVRGLMGSERGYDVAAVTHAGANVPVLGDERGTKVRSLSAVNLCILLICALPLFASPSVNSARQMAWTSQSMLQIWKISPKTNCGRGTKLRRVAPLEYPEAPTVKTFLIWWRKPCRSGRRWRKTGRRRGRRRNSSFNVRASYCRWRIYSLSPSLSVCFWCVIRRDFCTVDIIFLFVGNEHRNATCPSGTTARRCLSATIARAAFILLVFSIQCPIRAKESLSITQYRPGPDLFLEPCLWHLLLPEAK